MAATFDAHLVADSRSEVRILKETLTIADSLALMLQTHDPRLGY